VRNGLALYVPVHEGSDGGDESRRTYEPRREAYCRRSMNEGARLQIGMDSLCCDLPALE